MTRINCVAPALLHGKHLVAEYRELPRVFGLVRDAAARGERPDLDAIPAYTLGRGHVRFFYPRLGYLADRHAALVTEMVARGYKPSFVGSLREVHGYIDLGWWGDWEPDSAAIILNIARLEDRIPGAYTALASVA